MRYKWVNTPGDEQVKCARCGRVANWIRLRWEDSDGLDRFWWAYCTEHAKPLLPEKERLRIEAAETA